MNLRDFRVGFRVLVKDPTYSAVAVLGLAVGLACCLLLLGYARYCWQYNAHVPDSDNVYVVKQRNNLDLGAPWYDQAPLLLLTAAKAVPGVKAGTGYVNWFPLTVQINGNVRKLQSLTVLPGFAEVMGLQVIRGDLEEALSRPDGLALTHSGAMRLFGTTDVLGRNLEVVSVHQSKAVVRIAAILRDPPANTTIPFESLNGVQLSLVPDVMRTEALTGGKGWLGNLLIRLQPGTSPDAVVSLLQHAVDAAPSIQKVPVELKEKLAGRKVMDIKLSGIRDAYFDREVGVNNFSMKVDRGSATMVAGLVVMGLLMLALASVNYVNLATIRVIRRQREIAMRKVLGASPRQLALQFVAESLTVSMLATALALGLTSLALPVFSELVGRDLSAVSSIENVLIALSIGMMLGLITAAHPAWVAFRVRPAQALAGRTESESVRSQRLRQSLSVLQVAAAMGLASFSIAVAWQTRFAMDASPGFDPAPLLVLTLPEDTQVKTSGAARNFVAALIQQSTVAGVAVTTEEVGGAKSPWSTQISRDGGGASVTMDTKSVSANFFEQYGIKPVAGRLFDARVDKEDDALPIVINAIAARQLGFALPAQAIGQTLLFTTYDHGVRGQIAKRIIGVAPDVRFYSLRAEPGATAYELWTAGATLTVRASGSVADADAAVRRLWPQFFPDAVIELRTAAKLYAANYEEDGRLAKMLALAAGIAMVIAACGFYVLSADAMQRRTREIALRKLYGARRRDIGRLVAKEVAAAVLIAAVVALPLAAIAVARYLASFSERAPIGAWPMAFALGFALAVSALAAARHAWVAMGLKPAVALRR